MRTRFTIDSNEDLATASFAYTDTLEVQRDYQVEYPMGLVYRMDKGPSESSSTKLMELRAQVDASNNTIVNLDPFPLNTSKGTSYLRLLRSTTAPQGEARWVQGGRNGDDVHPRRHHGGPRPGANIRATGTLTNTNTTARSSSAPPPVRHGRPRRREPLLLHLAR